MSSGSRPAKRHKRPLPGPQQKRQKSWTLATALLESVTKSHFDNQKRDFVPEGVIKDLVTRERVCKELQLSDRLSKDEASLVQFVLDKAKKLFATCVQVDLDGHKLRGATEMFKEYGFTDEDLPLPLPHDDHTHDEGDQMDLDDDSDTQSQDSYYSLDDEDASSHDGAGTKSLDRLPDTNESGVMIWNEVKRYNFVNAAQWMFLAPVLSTKISNYDLAPSTILPFVTMETEFKEGAFSRVYKVSVHKDHYEDPEPPDGRRPEFFAIKEIVPPNKEERQVVAENWGKEANMLQDMNQLDEHVPSVDERVASIDEQRRILELARSHIVRFITAFTKGEEGSHMRYFLMFEWADGGSLRDLWKQNPKVVLTEPFLRDVISQLRGLAAALCATHNLDRETGVRHGDLKPENILWFKGEGGSLFGRLKIGDWGLAKNHNTATYLRTKNTTTKHGTILYEPPEVHYYVHPVKRLSRLYDIWSMGCVILELLIWLLYGYDEVLRFNEEVKGDSTESSPCYQRVGDDRKAKVHDVVVQWMNYMAADPACASNTALGELLKLVRERLLVVELGEYMGTTYDKSHQPNSMARPVANNNGATSSSAPRQIPRIDITPSSTTDPSSSGSNSLGATGPTTPGRFRAQATHLLDWLENRILDEDHDEDFWAIDDSQRRGPPPKKLTMQDPSSLLSTNSAAKGRSGRDLPNNPVPEIGSLTIQQPKILDQEWEIYIDNAFASAFFTSIARSPSLSLPHARASARLCRDCQHLDFFGKMGFRVDYDPAELERRAGGCDLCALFWKTCMRYNGSNRSRTVRFERAQSSLRMNGSGPPVLSICRNNDPKGRPDVQIGFPKLPEAGSPTHFEVMKQWLQLCDDRSKHPRCHPVKTRGRDGSCLPTRLIDVGRVGDDLIRMWATKPGDKAEYIALTHPWGSPPHFMTDVSNLDRHMRQGIRMSSLPATFRDAVVTTRALGQRYLWIDSICIVQGPGGDFASEAEKMETVFSAAYCVIAASRSRGHRDGFLQPRRERDYVAMRSGSSSSSSSKTGVGASSPPFYVCENIDDFQQHVLEGYLNTRGWVLQEHALARRTIFFTEHQTYWECGDGVRCETLTGMKNNLSAFLGDPNFPRIIMSASRGERIIRFQNLYATYSGLALTRAYDRPIAIRGIEDRLLAAFEGARGGFGVIDDRGHGGLLRRSLLWVRAEGEGALARIRFPAEEEGEEGQKAAAAAAVGVVPSWSWMAYLGRIDYLNPRFGNIDWEEVRSPWSTTAPPASSSSLGAKMGLVPSATLGGRVRTIKGIDPTSGLPSGKLCFDRPGGSEKPRTLQCLVLGVEQGAQPPGSRLHYFILVAPTAARARDEGAVYERIGAGYLPGRFISAPEAEIKVC